MIEEGKNSRIEKSVLGACGESAEFLLKARGPRYKMGAEEVERKLKELERDDYHVPLKEYRCSCGRLLGRFNGQAEVKCSKCGKMNVIGVERNVDSCITRQCR